MFSLYLLLFDIRNGGTTDNGNLVSLFFDPSNRSDILDLFDHKNQTERDMMDDILTRMNVCLSTINSDNFIDVDLFETYCRDTQIKLRQFLPWMEFSTSVHMFLAHGPQFIRANGNRGLLQYSESPLEVTKVVGLSLVLFNNYYK